MIDVTPITTIISGIIDAPSESRNVELKPSIPWGDINQQYDLQKVVKSILGISNIKDGGKIILGIKQNPDKTFTVEGMDVQHLQTYDQDRIYQIVRNFGDPAPRFDIKNMEYQGKNFIVFSVQEFLYSPVICIRSGKQTGNDPLEKGALYTRTHKPETKKVDNETEMREIINLAIDKEIENWTPRIQKLSGTEQSNIIGRTGRVTIAGSKFLDELKDIKP